MVAARPLRMASDPSAGPTPVEGSAPLSGPLVDRFGRIHNNLRVSVTDRCNLRCTYCMPEDVVFRDKSELLRFEEIEAFVRAAAPLGIDKVRLTGGEPLLRRELDELVGRLVRVPGVRDVGVTTNGLLLGQQSQRLWDAGLRRLNVSLDTLDEGRFRQLTRRDGLPQVLGGLDAAARAGFTNVKVNAVAIRNLTEADVVPLARLARERGWEMRFIEYMPIGADAWERDKVLFGHEILAMLADEFGPLVPDPAGDPRAPAQDYLYADGGGRVGLIASISRPFCGSCNRLRLTADGKLRHCLFALEETDVRPMLRGGPGDLARTIREVVWSKWEGHEINTAKFVRPERTMHAIGG